MTRTTSLLLCLAACCLLPGCKSHGGVYVVRHADRDGSLDKLKIPQGTERARALADRLRDAKISAIFSTDTVRTKSTAQPLATKLGLDIVDYSSVAEVANTVKGKYQGKNVLVVGHSDTVPKIVTALGAKLPGELPLDRDGYIHHDDYDNLVFVLFNSQGGAGAVHSTYGAATAPP